VLAKMAVQGVVVLCRGRVELVIRDSEAQRSRQAEECLGRRFCRWCPSRVRLPQLIGGRVAVAAATRARNPVATTRSAYCCGAPLPGEEIPPRFGSRTNWSYGLSELKASMT